MKRRWSFTDEAAMLQYPPIREKSPAAALPGGVQAGRSFDRAALPPGGSHFMNLANCKGVNVTVEDCQEFSEDLMDLARDAHEFELIKRRKSSNDVGIFPGITAGRPSTW